jgi:hypothetical protein
MATAEKTTDHQRIKSWVEARGGRPACVSTTREYGPGCLLRIDFPGYGDDDDLETIEWSEFFEVFEDNELAFLYDPDRDSRFSKFISREVATD